MYCMETVLYKNQKCKLHVQKSFYNQLDIKINTNLPKYHNIYKMTCLNNKAMSLVDKPPPILHVLIQCTKLIVESYGRDWAKVRIISTYKLQWFKRINICIRVVHKFKDIWHLLWRRSFLVVHQLFSWSCFLWLWFRLSLMLRSLVVCQSLNILKTCCTTLWTSKLSILDIMDRGVLDQSI